MSMIIHTHLKAYATSWFYEAVYDTFMLSLTDLKDRKKDVILDIVIWSFYQSRRSFSFEAKLKQQLDSRECFFPKITKHFHDLIGTVKTFKIDMREERFHFPALL